MSPPPPSNSLRRPDSNWKGRLRPNWFGRPAANSTKRQLRLQPEPNSRGTQLFINYKDNSFLDEQRFAPFGEVISGMEVADQLNSEYGSKPQDAQGTISTEGNKFLMSSFPKLDYIRKATIEK